MRDPTLTLTDSTKCLSVIPSMIHHRRRMKSSRHGRRPSRTSSSVPKVGEVDHEPQRATSGGVTKGTALPDAWERQPKETHKSYLAFCEYRNLGPLRSLR